MRWLFLLAAALLCSSLLWAAMVELHPPWLAAHAEFVALGLAPPGAVAGIDEVAACTGAIERCTSCHLGVSRMDLARSDLPRHLRAHPTSLAAHPPDVVGCTACHGGTGRALSADNAHALPGTTQRDPLMAHPHLEASCARCHVPGAVPGTERLVRGAEIFLTLGCAVCHPLSPETRSWDYGTDLGTMGRRSLAFLRESVLEPAANFPGTTMPSFRHTLDPDPEILDDLLLYVQALALPRARRCDVPDAGGVWVKERCVVCHAGEGGAARGRFEHRCVFLRERRQELACQACHQEELQTPGLADGWCPAIGRHRDACVTCHTAGSAENGSG